MSVTFRKPRQGGVRRSQPKLSTELEGMNAENTIDSLKIDVDEEIISNNQSNVLSKHLQRRRAINSRFIGSDSNTLKSQQNSRQYIEELRKERATLDQEESRGGEEKQEEEELVNILELNIPDDDKIQRIKQERARRALLASQSDYKIELKKIPENTNITVRDFDHNRQDQTNTLLTPETTLFQTKEAEERRRAISDALLDEEAKLDDETGASEHSSDDFEILQMHKAHLHSDQTSKIHSTKNLYTLRSQKGVTIDETIVCLKILLDSLKVRDDSLSSTILNLNNELQTVKSQQIMTRTNLSQLNTDYQRILDDNT